MNKFNYILNDLAFDTYVIKCLYGYPTDEDIKICENQIKLLQQKYKQLQDRINKAIEYINEQECFMFGILENDEFVWKDSETKKDLFKILKGDSNDNEQ